VGSDGFWSVLVSCGRFWWILVILMVSGRFWRVLLGSGEFW